jgi:hypothetical protein
VRCGPQYPADPAEVTGVSRYRNFADAAHLSRRQPGSEPPGEPLQATTVSWHFVTMPDEQQRCCAVIDGERCGQATRFLIEATDGGQDDYAYTCADHVHLALGPGHVTARLN